VGGKGYLTTKGKREDRFDPTKTKGAEKKESILVNSNPLKLDLSSSAN
jgi:hypothetical protein